MSYFSENSVKLKTPIKKWENTFYLTYNQIELNDDKVKNHF